MKRHTQGRLPDSALSPREMEVARLVADGLEDKQIAGVLVISIRTVKKHVDRIAAKLGTKGNRRVAIGRYIERIGIVSLNDGRDSAAA